ncbi:hypothetical protein HPULCUR_000745 [Helicostylum pulchrum]|uniref:Uncharacterized protein n=1 Tax=Helicostylum pulchrum TaxID=562976 RepID=A0ABP9XKR4_9FUNG
MASPSLLCRVQALYAFESSDPSSLRFEEGDYIDVLAKLPSGWWDGWCNGNRGWFPSNYVKVIEDYGSTGLASSSTTTTKKITDLFDDRVGGIEAKRYSLPAHWTIENKEDGTASYYLNTLTGEMRSTFPFEDATCFYECESDEDSFTSTIESNSVLDVNYLPNTEDAKWIQRTPFLYNMSSQDTAWQTNSQEPKLLPTPRWTDKLSWNKLLIHVTFPINNLITTVKNGQRPVYKKCCGNIVESVRFMLVASGTISKDSLHIKTNNTLRCHHRAMMASLSKLILSCQLCADGTVTDVSRLLSDCHELLVAVRNFISTCESIPVQVNQVDPIILSPQDPMIRRQSSSSIVMDQGIRAKYELQSDLVESLDAYGASMQESMEALMTNLSRNSDSRCSLAVLLFTQYRNFGNQNGQFLSIIEDIAFDQVSKSPMMKELNVAKQKLYDSLGILFFKMQMMTDESIALEKTIWEMQEAAKSIIDAIRLVCDHMSNLVQERNSSSILIGDGSSFLDGPATPDLSYKRSHSLSIETTKVSTKLTNRSSAPVDNNSNNHSMELNLLKERSNSALIENPSKHTSAKLKQFFGDDVPDPLTINTTTTTNSNTNAAAATTPTDRNSNSTLVPSSTSGVVADEHSYLQYDYSPNEIVFTSDGSVKGGTLRALVERMTLHDYLDMNFNNTFLLTYRSFCTSLELLELLQERYKIQPPTDLTPEELEIWHTKKQKLIRLRVFNVLKIWLEQYYYEEDSVILDRLLFFSNTTIKETLSFSAYQLERLIQKRKDACKDLKKLVITQQMDSPDPILPRNLKKFKLLDLDPIEMARQLTLMDFKMYSAIKPVECLDKAWSRDAAASSNNNAAPVAANIQASIDYCNQVTTWVSDEILSQSEVKKRSTQIKYWVNVAERCRMLNNFNTCMAILSAFDNSAVGRLKRTWEMVGARTNHIVSQIRKLMGANRNFNQYRALIHSVNPPCIPFLGIYLQDLTFIEDGNPNFLKTSKDLINFAKRAKTAEVIREMQQYQTMGYQFRMVDEIQVFIMDSLHSIRDEDQLYRESLKLEPK